MKRSLTHLQNSEPVTDGDGVKIRRSAARRAMHTFDPFLMLDEIASDDAADYIGGFPEHPHRGFETVTYMLEGQMRHRDHMGNEGLLVSGGVQWMTAGRGVLHSEIPEQTKGRLHGFQLWINLPAAEKMGPANYREYAPEQIPVVALSANSSAKVIAGAFTYNGATTQGPIADVTTQPDYFDISLAAGETLSLPVDVEKRVVLYVYQGELSINDDNDSRTLSSQQFGMLSNGDTVELTATSDSRLLLLAGKPIGEPIANRGPFVMNTQEELEQAMRDYDNGTLTH